MEIPWYEQAKIVRTDNGTKRLWYEITDIGSLVVERSLLVWEVRVRFPAESNQRFQIGIVEAPLLKLDI